MATAKDSFLNQTLCTVQSVIVKNPKQEIDLLH